MKIVIFFKIFLLVGISSNSYSMYLGRSVAHIPKATRLRIATKLVRSFWGQKNEIREAVKQESIQVPMQVPIQRPGIHFPQRKQKNLKGFSAIAGIIPEEAYECLDFIKNAKKFDDIGAKKPRGLLFVGPPGTGKTSIARAIAEEAGDVPFYADSATDYQRRYYGDSAKRVREAFECTRNKAKDHSSKQAILFVDELDGLSSRTNHNCNRELINAFLNEMDGFVKDESLTVMGATNTADDLDPALKRPGRFDRIIEIALPDFESRKEVLKLYFSFTKYFEESINENFIDELAGTTEGFSQADLRNLVNEAAILAVRDNAEAIKDFHVISALKVCLKRKIACSQSIKE